MKAWNHVRAGWFPQKLKLYAVGFCCIAFMMAGPALAQAADPTEALQSQIDALQKQVDALKAAQAAQAAQPQTTQGSSYAAQAPSSPGGNGINIVNTKGINIKFLGFIEAAGFYRDRNLSSDVDTPFQKLPLANTANYYQDEVRFSARQSRLALLATADYDPTTHLAAYYEMDFLGAAQTANSNESNSYNLRIRHIYATADWDNLGLHLLGGQTWSLTTMNDQGITPRNEVTPLTIDAQYAVGFTWTRQPQFRIVKDWDKTYWLALSVENPQTTEGGTSASTNYSTNLASGAAVPDNLLNTDNKISANNYPDFVAKAAWEPGWGHFEVFDLFRDFESTTATTSSPTATSRSIVANSVGAGAILPIVPGNLKVQLSGQYGQGIGRYGSAQLADVTEDKLGNLHPLTELRYLTGLIWDPNSAWNFYAYYGQEEINQNSFNSGSTPYGYGSSLLNNSGCGTLGGTCTGNIRSVSEATVGVWWKFYQGKFGKMVQGLQYAYSDDKYFTAIGGAPKADDQQVYTSFRFYW